MDNHFSIDQSLVANFLPKSSSTTDDTSLDFAPSGTFDLSSIFLSPTSSSINSELCSTLPSDSAITASTTPYISVDGTLFTMPTPDFPDPFKLSEEYPNTLQEMMQLISIGNDASATSECINPLSLQVPPQPSPFIQHSSRQQSLRRQSISGVSSYSLSSSLDSDCGSSSSSSVTGSPELGEAKTSIHFPNMYTNPFVSKNIHTSATDIPVFPLTGTADPTLPLLTTSASSENSTLMDDDDMYLLSSLFSSVPLIETSSSSLPSDRLSLPSTSTSSPSTACATLSPTSTPAQASQPPQWQSSPLSATSATNLTVSTLKPFVNNSHCTTPWHNELTPTSSHCIDGNIACSSPSPYSSSPESPSSFLLSPQSPSFVSNDKTVTGTPKKSRSVIRQRRVAGQLVCPKPGCGYRYNLRRELNRHMHTHAFATIDRYQCMTCRAGLCRLDSVKRHMEAKGKQACLAKGTYGEFNDRGELIRIRECKPSWYTSAAALRASEKA